MAFLPSYNTQHQQYGSRESVRLKGEEVSKAQGLYGASHTIEWKSNFRGYLGC